MDDDENDEDIEADDGTDQSDGIADTTYSEIGEVKSLILEDV